MGYKTDIEIATGMRNETDHRDRSKAGIDDKYLEQYGSTKQRSTTIC